MSYPQQGWQQPQYQPQQAYQGAPVSGQQYAAPPQMPGYTPQPGWDQNQVPQPGPQVMPQPGQLQCRICGCMPAVNTTFRGHQGILILMRFLHTSGPFCHNCGMATYRKMTADTLVQGWWSYSSWLITPITVIINLTRRGKVANLPAPVPPPDGRHGRPLDPGKPLYTRPQCYIVPGLILIVILLYIVLLAVGSTQGA